MAEVARAAGGRTPGLWTKVRRNWPYYLFVAPFFITWTMTTPFTLGYAAMLSFFEWKAARTDWKFVGLRNYQWIFQDRAFLAGMENLVYYWIGMVIPFILLAMAVSFVLHQFKWGAWVRTIMMLPMVTSGPVIVLVMKQVFARSGIINDLIGFVGIPRIYWLGEPWTARIVVVLLSWWSGLGTSALIFGGAMDAIPAEQYEAAQLDGANKFRQFVHITIPALRPVILYFLITGTMGVLNIMDTPYLLTGGGPRRATTSPAYVMWTTSFYGLQLGYGTAMAWVLGFVTLLITLVALWMGFIRKKRTS